MTDTTGWISAVRDSHDLFTSLLSTLDADRVTQPSYASEWSIADVASHLGSQAEIFELFLNAGLEDGTAPGGEVFGPIWDRWNGLAPSDQVRNSVRANEALVTRIEQLTPAEQDRFSLAAMGQQLDLAGLLGLRLGEHAVHTWDIAVALDPGATVAAESVRLLVDRLPALAQRTGKASSGPAIALTTTDPERHATLAVEPTVELTFTDQADPDALTVPAEALVRLVYGRLDREHTPRAVTDDPRVDQLRSVFAGF